MGNKEELWRISVRVPFLADTDFVELEQQVRAAAAQALAGHPDRLVEVGYTGISHLYHVTQQAVIADLYWNFGTAFLLICPFMVIAVRSGMLGALAMLPNICPAILIFGAIGLVGCPMDIGMAMTASVALGIAVDDTTHLLLRFRELEKTEPTSWSGADGRLSSMCDRDAANDLHCGRGTKRVHRWATGRHDAVCDGPDCYLGDRLAL